MLDKNPCRLLCYEMIYPFVTGIHPLVRSLKSFHLVVGLVIRRPVSVRLRKQAAIMAIQVLPTTKPSSLIFPLTKMQLFDHAHVRDILVQRIPPLLLSLSSAWCRLCN